MHIDLRATDRLTGKRPLDLTPVFTALAQALPGSGVDLTRLRVVADWVQYRQNFRNPVDVREILPSALETRQASANREIAVDLRRTGAVDLAGEFARALAPDAVTATVEGAQFIEDWVRGAESRIWAFNGLYWGSLGLWEAATGREYEEALPSGESDARNIEMADDLIWKLFRVWDDLAARRALPEDLYVVELGVGNGNQAAVWLDEFQRLDREHRGEYYRRLHYLMGDYSPHVLERARTRVQAHAEHVSGLVMDARSPSRTLGFLRGKAFLIYLSNVYDNLPTDEFVRIGGQLFRVEVRSYIAAGEAEAIAPTVHCSPADLPALVSRLLDLGPELLAKAEPARFPEGVTAAVGFWRTVWDAVRLQERYVPSDGLDAYDIAPGISGELMRPLIEANGDVRMHVSNGAAASFLDSLGLLHPYGVLECHDIFVTNVHQYQGSYRGPGKYDGSVVNWVNGPLLDAICKRYGFEAQFSPFRYREGSNVMTLTARVRE